MRNFLVNVNGTKYEVAVEEIDGKTAPVAAPAAPKAAAPAAAPAAPAAPKAAAPAASAGGTPVLCPMPGTIMAVNVKDGDKVTAGQAIFSLEARKMESDIPASATGVVRGITVHKGEAVDVGKLLCSIE